MKLEHKFVQYAQMNAKTVQGFQIIVLLVQDWEFWMERNVLVLMDIMRIYQGIAKFVILCVQHAL